jgi:hypothetical protein
LLRAGQRLKLGDESGAEVWRRIISAIERMQSLKETMH